MAPDTIRKLAEMTDEGVFERLATAVLRSSDARLRSLSHPGVNADGKTVKSPLDGITLVPGAVPPQMIAVHHTICSARALEKKWLHDPSKVKSRRQSKSPAAPAGDVIKTIELVKEERKRTPDLHATLVLTTNQEPGESLVRDLHAVGNAANLLIDIWPRSRLADFLDNEPKGQWLRRQYLGIDQELLSEETLSELSQKCLHIHRPPDRPEAWVQRTLDVAIRQTDGAHVVFLVAESGAGKSVACYKQLVSNASSGGFSLVLTDEAIASSLSLEQAIEKTLTQLQPSLAFGCGPIALGMSNSNRRLLIAVEDINRSGRGATLVEKISRWDCTEIENDGAPAWQLLCPVWPQVMSSLTDEARRRVNSLAIVGALFSPEEGAKAVGLRRTLGGRPVTKLEAARISEALGRDPLLIALHDPEKTPDVLQTIAQFIETSLQRVAAARGEFSASEYRKALSALAKGMLLNSQLEPSWLSVLEWPELARHALALRHLVHQAEVVRLIGPSTDETLTFRHDRVREWILAQAAFDLLHSNSMPPEIAAEPYFSEIFGLALIRHDASDRDVSTIAVHNPLALFCAVPHFREPAAPSQAIVLAAVEDWLKMSPAGTRRDRHIHWAAVRVLGEAEGPSVRPLIAQLDGNSWHALRARFRNGDLMGGVGLCLPVEPGVSMAGHTAFLDHMKTRLGANLIRALASLLSNDQLTDPVRVGALRLAGHIGESSLADAIRVCWKNHPSKHEHLREYLWACAQCVDIDPTTLLGPVCDSWAALPHESSVQGRSSPRDELASGNLRFAFHKRLPSGAVRFFIERAAEPDLKWPITYMLHELDHPDAVEFVVRQLAAISEELEGTDRFSPFLLSAKSDWERRQERTGREMSDTSRARLRSIWQDRHSTKHVREQAFGIWASTYHQGDLCFLRTVPNSDTLVDKVLWHRLRLRDYDAIPALLQKLEASNQAYWWQLGRYIWSSDLTKALDAALERRRTEHHAVGDDSRTESSCDWILSELITGLPSTEAEAILTEHWDHLSNSRHYIIAAISVATPKLRALVANAVRSSTNPKELFKYLSSEFGLKQKGRHIPLRLEQVEAVVPYLDLLDELAIYDLWNACNEHGWFLLRRAHLDSKFPSNMKGAEYLDAARAMKELDNYLERPRHWLIDYWVDDFLKTGVSLDYVMSLIGRWLYEKTDIRALEIACAAVLHAGDRRHLDLLQQASKIEPREQAAAIVADTAFGVRRRTLKT